MHTTIETKPRAAQSAIVDSPVNQIVQVLTWGVLAVCLLVWAVIGLVFWIPLLIRATVLFSVSLVHATLRGESALRAGRMLREAVNFYRHGFTVAIDAVRRSPAPDPDAMATEHEVSTGRLVKEFAFAAVIWYALLYWLGVVTFTPGNLWDTVVALPWMELITSTATGIVAFFQGLLGP